MKKLEFESKKIMKRIDNRHREANKIAQEALEEIFTPVPESDYNIAEMQADLEDLLKQEIRCQKKFKNIFLVITEPFQQQISKKAGSSYLDICDTVNEMEKAGLVEWEEEQRKYVVLVETPPQTGMMSKEIQEYILKNYRYRSFSPNITKETNKYYNEVCETVKQMEKAGVVEWKKEQGKYVVIAEPSTDYISQTVKEKDYTPQNCYQKQDKQL